jgi:excisionase family DNA binding protein
MNESTLTVQQFYSLAEAGKILHVSRTNLYYRIRDGKIPTVRMGKRILIPGAYFERLAEQALREVL